MSKIKSQLRKKPIVVIVITTIAILAAALIYLHYHVAKTPKSFREQACEQAAAEPKPSPHDAPLEGQSIYAAYCNGTLQPATPAQSQQ